MGITGITQQILIVKKKNSHFFFLQSSEKNAIFFNYQNQRKQIPSKENIAWSNNSHQIYHTSCRIHIAYIPQINIIHIYIYTFRWIWNKWNIHNGKKYILRINIKHIYIYIHIYI